MSLRYALLALLLDGDATGYQLAKRSDVSVAHFWHALPGQLYAELAHMEQEGLVRGEVIAQSGRPNKRVFSMTAAGRDALAAWIETPARIQPLKSDALVKMYAADMRRADDVIAWLQEYVRRHEERLAAHEAIRTMMFHGRSEDEFIQTTHHVGPYLTLKRGLMYESENIEWGRWAIEAMRARAERHGPQR